MSRVAAFALVLAVGACRNLDVVTESYATLAEAHGAGAADRGWLPKGLPPGTTELRIAHDLDTNRRWGLFSFPAAEGPVLRAILVEKVSLAGQTCNPPRRIEWWPVLIRGNLDPARIAATGLQAYSARESDVIVAVNWSQGRAYYWTKE
jgi:hypothetical protein